MWERVRNDCARRQKTLHLWRTLMFSHPGSWGVVPNGGFDAEHSRRNRLFRRCLLGTARDCVGCLQLAQIGAIDGSNVDVCLSGRFVFACIRQTLLRLGHEAHHPFVG